MPTQANKPAKQRTTPERWYTVAREEVLNGQTMLGAMITAGYKESYARCSGKIVKTDPRYCRIKEQVKAELLKKTDYTLVTWLNDTVSLLENTIESPRDKTVATICLNMLGKHLGAYEADKDKPSGEIGQLLVWLSDRKSIPSKEIPILDRGHRE